jgi:hypothetical protein
MTILHGIKLNEILRETYMATDINKMTYYYVI